MNILRADPPVAAVAENVMRACQRIFRFTAVKNFGLYSKASQSSSLWIQRQVQTPFSGQNEGISVHNLTSAAITQICEEEQACRVQRKEEQLKCSCKEFGLYHRLICCHTVALAEFETRLCEQLASVGEKLSLESLSKAIEAGKAPDAGLKPGGRRRAAAWPQQFSKTVPFARRHIHHSPF